MSAEIGKRLRRAREALGLSIEDIQAQTRIDKRYLIALENGQFDALPSTIYVRSYLRTYANIVGENPQSLLRSYRPVKRTPTPQEQTPVVERSYRNDMRMERVLPSAPARPSSTRVGQARNYSALQDNEQLSGRYRPISELEESMFESTLTRSDYLNHSQPTQEQWQSEQDLSHTRTNRARGTRTSDLSEPVRHNPSTYPAYSTAVPTVKKNELTYQVIPTSSLPVHTSRKPQMPVNLPDPEELGIEGHEEHKAEEVNSVTLPSRSATRQSRVIQEKYKDDDFEKENKSRFTFGKFYSWLLIIGAFALAIAIALFMWYEANTASSKEETPAIAMAQNKVKDTSAQPKRPIIFTPMYSSDYSPDRYELVGADKLEFKIKGLKGSSHFEIREQEVGDPVVSKDIQSTQEFSQSFDTSIWLTLDVPDHVEVTINGHPVRTSDYTKQKDIEINFLKQ